MADTIFRQPTDTEKKDFRPIKVDGRQTNPVVDFRKKLEKTEREYFNRYSPFCSRCGKLDFKDLIENQFKKIERSTGYRDTSQVIAPNMNLSEYGKSDRFELVNVSDAMEPITTVTGTVQRQKKIGEHRDYRCKINGCGISIFVPIDAKVETSETPIKSRGKK